MKEAIACFLRVLDSNDTSTGGGSAAAVTGAMAAALVAMVARLSIGRKGLQKASFYEALITSAERLRTELLRGSHKDAEAFALVMASFKMVKETKAQQTARRRAINKAMLAATRIPLSNAEKCHQVLLLKKQLGDHMNANAASDLECAGHLATAGFWGCLANVKINLPAIKNASQLAEITQRVAELQGLQ